MFEEIYNAVMKIPRGKVATYGQVAAMIGHPKAARVVGYALHNNPLPGIIACHRVVNRNGFPAPGFAFGGEDVQKSMLEAEGVVFESDGHIDLTKYGWDGR